MKLSDQSSNEEKKTGEKRTGKDKTIRDKTIKKKNGKDKLSAPGKREGGAGKRFQVKKTCKDLGFKKFRKDAGEGRARANKNILRLTYAFSAVFVLMAGYLGWFIQFKSENVIGSSYNARLDQFADRIIRGSIMSSDKTVLA